MEKTRLMPCPFCGDSDVQLIDQWDGKKGTWTVWCRPCDIEGPMGSKKEAINKWNKRAAFATGDFTEIKL